MLENSEIIKVRNRANATLVYDIPDLNVVRTFAKDETKELTMEELRKLSYVPGGQNLLANCLLLNNQEAVKELIGDVEPEYFYTEDNVKNIMLHGSLNEFKDMLDFAPTGVLDIVKSMAVELRLNDISKREAIKEALNYDVTNAIRIQDEAKEEEAETTETTGKQRRAAVPTEATAAAATKTRRAATSKYKIVET